MLKLNPNVMDLYNSLQRSDDTFNFENHIGSVCGIDWSPYHRLVDILCMCLNHGHSFSIPIRNLFLCAGVDGKVKLFHILEQNPIRTWEPLAYVVTAPNGNILIKRYSLGLNYFPGCRFWFRDDNGGRLQPCSTTTFRRDFE
jgi:WD40 repeat protein